MKTPVVVVATALCATLAVPAAAVADHQPVVLAGCTGQAIGLFPPQGGSARVVVPPYAYDPDVSPDGKRLAYIGVVDKFPFLFVRELDSGKTKRLTDVGWSDPDWAPDGRRIAISDSSGNGRLGIVEADEAQPQVRVVPGVSGGSPSWSPDGEFLAFSERDPSTSGRIVAVRPDGRDRTSLGVAGTSPAWSPDGREIAYRSGRDIKSVSLPDLTPRYVLQAPLATRAFRSPAWSPDGLEIYAEQVDTAGSTRTTRIIRTASNAGAPDAGDPVSEPNTGCPSLGGGHPRAADSTPPEQVRSLTLQPAPSRIAVTATSQLPSDNAGVIVRYREGDVAPLTPADGHDGGRTLTGRTVLPRLQPSTTYSVTVFPVDWAGNVGPGRSASATTPAQVATSLSVSPPYPAYVVAGQYVDLRARLLREDTGAPLGNAPVALYGRRQNQPDVLIAHLRTDADGWVSSRRQPLAPTRYTLKYAGASPLVASTASRLALVQPQVRLTLSRNPVPRGAAASVLVQVRPVRPGMNVRVSQFAGSTMVLTRLVRSDANSNVRVRLRTDRAGTFNLRVDTGSNTDLEPRTVFGPVLRVQ